MSRFVTVRSAVARKCRGTIRAVRKAMSEKRVLIVDDARTIRFAIREYLESAGFAVSEAEDCRGAREALRRHSPHAVVLDHHLPDGVSLDLVAEMIALNAGLVIIVLTAHGSDELAAAAMRLGAKCLLHKPIELNALRRKIDELLVAG